MRIITTHLGADFDALGAAMGMRLLVPDARLVFPGSQEVAVRRFLDAEHITLPEVRVRELRRARIHEAVVVDCSSFRRLAEVGELIAAAGCPVRVVDHHQDASDTIPGAEVLTEPVAATCTVVTRELQRVGAEPDALTASMLLLGIYEDTGGLTYVDTTTIDLEAAAWLLSRGARLDWVRRYVLRPLEPDQLALLNQLVEGAVEHNVAGCRVVLSVARPSERLEEAAYVVHRYAEIFDLPVVVVLLEVPPQLVVIARSTVPEVDAGKLMSGVGGGGHATAAAARLRGRSTVEVSESLLTAIGQALAGRWTASSLATPFLHSCSAAATVAEAKERLVRLRINAMPVEQDGELIGVVTRQILDQAAAAGLGERPVTMTMRPGIPEAPPDASPEDLQRLFMEGHTRFVLVRLASGWGVLTRMDLFRRLYERQLAEGARLDRRVASARLVVQDMGRQLSRALPTPLLDVLSAAGELATADGMRAFLVGGAVRDVLLGRPLEDVDVVVEGNGIQLAARLAEALGGHSHPHEPFLTAVVHLPGGLRVDVATARTEFYRRPAALPEVETSAIRQDLYRRDFTINAMAMGLAPGHRGELLDFFGGRRDIERRQIRVLHSLSFLDDPTRVLRAVRFSTRLGFGVASETRTLVAVAVSEGVFAHLSGERLRDELALLLEEDHPAEALGELANLGVFDTVLPGVAWSQPLRRFVGQLHEVLAWAALEEVGEETRWPTYLVALATRAGERGGEALARRLALSGRLGRMVGEARGRIEKALAALAQDRLRPSEVVALVERNERAVVLVTMAMAGEETRRLLRQALTVWMRLPVPVTGARLRAAGVRPGPGLGEAMRRTRDAMLNGEVAAENAVEHAIAVALRLEGGPP
ncbi:MAG TPA: CBS domain-containing protein [Thermoanaerobaculaceae bacterium]|nr:CBS domain-containing protein [Thermoanaerobaculaceae bacterium]HPS77219.1 CBS domain-containing protein [Thermoanaerobaculaceae bacterium]